MDGYIFLVGIGIAFKENEYREAVLACQRIFNA
jgi:hypothetical protein